MKVFGAVMNMIECKNPYGRLKHLKLFRNRRRRCFVYGSYQGKNCISAIQ